MLWWIIKVHTLFQIIDSVSSWDREKPLLELAWNYHGLSTWGEHNEEKKRSASCFLRWFESTLSTQVQSGKLVLYLRLLAVYAWKEALVKSRQKRTLKFRPIKEVFVNEAYRCCEIRCASVALLVLWQENLWIQAKWIQGTLILGSALSFWWGHWQSKILSKACFFVSSRHTSNRYKTSCESSYNAEKRSFLPALMVKEANQKLHQKWKTCWLESPKGILVSCLRPGVK